MIDTMHVVFYGHYVSLSLALFQLSPWISSCLAFQLFSSLQMAYCLQNQIRYQKALSLILILKLRCFSSRKIYTIRNVKT